MSKLALRFISGKYKGGEFLLREGAEIIIGRSSELDVVLMEDMVSRKHATIRVDEEKLHLEDRGSTNGTFVNGEKISTATVVKGDRILIGTSIMKVVDAADETSPALDDSPNAESSTVTDGPRYKGMGHNTTVHSGARSMSGTIAEVPLPDLIQLFSTSKKTGTLLLNRESVIAKIHMDKGRIIYASLSDALDLPPLKAMFRILSWEDGTFDLLGPEPHNFPDHINLPTEHILMEGLRQLDELRHKQDKLPSMDTRIAVISPLEKRLADLDEDELDVFQLALVRPTVQEILDRNILGDSDVANILLVLIRKKYVGVSDDLVIDDIIDNDFI